ncbi:auxin efflux carrier [Natrinema pellirubrum DSM 15624]|uniref:Auxin efflux carrier n=1 Tax=Natrinema pellirubrum (strain DSM 15624 / CIP 106293 / JCM 10476 / NCIMB 786 / 157) TaxID=797303 RepID=L0JHP4_NATP1|nr:AEC family transporter [Natrinema pellirubrum]AGB31065.1 putative permease [Natrinema pellirubrum DSM 15624]ELY81095.1 auxin efflux carrier [Natrinema pellirubrum DSM 15624]
MEVVGRLVALLVVLVGGAGVRAIGVLDDRRTALLNDLAYYVALPALIFVSTFDRSIAALLSPALLGGLLLVVFGTAGVAWVVHWHRDSSARRSVAIVQSYHSNLGYLGLPLVAATFDPTVTAIASVVLGVVSLTQVPLTVVILSSLNAAGATVTGELRRLATNPVLVTLLAGLTIGSLGLGVPSPVAVGLDAVGSLALPVALLCVGASLDIDRSSIDAATTAAVVACKVVVMPALAWLVFSALAVDTATFIASVVMLGTPTAVSTFVFASELGGDPEFASLNVFVTTLSSIATLFVLITLVG